MKIKIDSDEWDNVLNISPFGQEIEVTVETAARWKRIEEEFEQMQNEMADCVNKAAAVEYSRRR